MDVVVALNRGKFLSVEAIKATHDDLLAQNKLPTRTTLKMVITGDNDEAVDSVSWFKRDTDFEANDEDDADGGMSAPRVLHAAIRDASSPDFSRDLAAFFTVNFDRRPVSLLLVSNLSKAIASSSEEAFLRLQKDRGVSLIRVEEGALPALLAKITRCFAKNPAAVPNPYAPSKTVRVQQAASEMCGLKKLFDAQWEVLCKNTVKSRKNPTLLPEMDATERRDAAVRAALGTASADEVERLTGDSAVLKEMFLESRTSTD